MTKLFAALFAVLLYVPTMIVLNAWVLSKMWMWFVVEFFHLPPLTLVEAAGLATVIHAFTFRSDIVTRESGKGWDEVASRLLTGVLVPIFTLLYAYVIHLFAR